MVLGEERLVLVTGDDADIELAGIEATVVDAEDALDAGLDDGTLRQPLALEDVIDV